MDLTSSITNMQHASLVGSVQIAVAKKMLDAQRQNGAAAVAMIEAAGNAIQSSGDALVAAATGLGGQIDTFG